MNQTISVLILAGQRAGVEDPLLECVADPLLESVADPLLTGVEEPLVAGAGVKRKALLPILGVPMINYVLQALDDSPAVSRPYWLSGLDISLLGAGLNQSPAQDGPASSVVAAAHAGLPYPFMVTTCDHPLLSPDMIEHFLGASLKSGADFTLGLATKSVIAPAYPHVKRTYLKFKDQHVSGCNLFFVRNKRGLEAIKFWRAAQNDRKRPFKLARRLGIGMLLKYASGQLTLKSAFETASKTLNITAQPILLPYPEAAIDVDKPSDLALVRQILSTRL